MLEYSEVADYVQEKQKVRDIDKYVKVIYKDPHPILENHKPQPCYVTERYKGFAKTIKDFQIRKDDIWIMSYPKTGTTLMTELVTVLLSGMDFTKLEETSLFLRSPYLEWGHLNQITDDRSLINYMIRRLCALSSTIPVDFLEMATKDPGRRVMKTHLPVNLLPTDLLSLNDHKMIYTVRNPKDAAVSVFHHYKNVNGYYGSITDMFEGYLNGEILYGSYFQHVDDYLRVSKLKKNFLMIMYEDMVSDMPAVVKRVAEFLEISLDESDIAKVADYVHFDQMKERKCSNYEDYTESSSIKGCGVATSFK